VQLDTPDRHPQQGEHHRQRHHRPHDEAGPPAEEQHDHDQDCRHGLEQVLRRVGDRLLHEVRLEDDDVQRHAERQPRPQQGEPPGNSATIWAMRGMISGSS
jgi:hypothetical protein